MDQLALDLMAYYDQDATLRAERQVDPERAIRRAEFLDLLRAEGRRTLLEVGTGPGRDATVFAAAGIQVSGVDLAAEQVRLARRAGVDAYQATIWDMPFPPRCFEAGWSMSTLLHVPDSRFDAAIDAIVSKLLPGAPLAVGLWGGVDHEGASERDVITPPRFFSRRSHDRLRRMLARAGAVERFVTWGESPGWQYQWALVRVRHRDAT
ncbi:methyltransferase domain-containing protein [Natronosporangium hydrolyticum]|uniref:Methyltransferase domain-containing protein n=1 Tax=Natronosporangium hydrolyticum TaxID=2811111 RepID=A0A895YCX9_9ACTN|nr:class I SAM-dependent methyltransferase [Natronosporangium hydrolyticum]QSB14065.1 methyltransferase domain-containing protein [Natronosporangium hydrolyticum]